MAQEVFFAEQTFTSELDAAYGYSYNPSGEYALTIGETYTVTYDGNTYTCVAMDGSAVMEGAAFLGNAAPFGLSGNGEPFAVGVFGGGLLIACLTDTAPTSHTIAIYQEVVGIVLKDRDGRPMHYVSSVVRLQMSDGGTKLFINEDTVARGVETTIDPDFSVGDMAVTPDKGTQFTRVTVKKPPTLTPENIAKDVNIGGVVGTHRGGGVDDRVDFTLNDNGEIVGATVYGQDCPSFAYSATLEWVDLTNCRAERIGDYAFYSCKALTSVTLPEGLVSIGTYAFYGCIALTSIVIPDSVTSIGNNAFNGCAALANVAIGSGAKSIGSGAFNGCSNLASITIPDGVTSIGSQAFYNCSALTSVVLPDSVTSIGSQAFYGCSNLASITIPDSVTSIGIQLLYNCAALTSIVIPDGVTSIGNQAFCGCTKLATVTIGSGVTSIGYRAFYSCSALASATFRDTTTWYVGTSAGATTTSVTVTSASTAATYLTSTHTSKYWTKK